MYSRHFLLPAFQLEPPKTLIGLALIIVLQLGGCSNTENETANSEANGWERVPLGTHAKFNDLVFVDDRHGWLAGGAHNTAGGLLGASQDGGLTWAFNGGIADRSATGLTAVHFFNRQLGLVGTDRGEILKTTDGGRSWRTKLKLADRFGNRVSRFKFPGYGVGYATVDGRLVRTDDFGESWHCMTSATRGCQLAPQCTGTPDGAKLDLSALAFRSASSITAVSGRYKLANSEDGGCSWQVSTGFNQQTPVRLSALAFVNAKQGWVAGEQGFVAVTQDGGQTWTLQNPGVGVNFRDVVFLDATTGYLVGERINRSGSVLLTTTTAGRQWETAYEVSNDLLQGLHVNVDGKLWAAGEVLDIAQGQHMLRFVGSNPSTQTNSIEATISSNADE